MTNHVCKITFISKAFTGRNFQLHACGKSSYRNLNASLIKMYTIYIYIPLCVVP